MEQLIRIKALAGLLWREDEATPLPEAEWDAILIAPCEGDRVLMEQVKGFVRRSLLHEPDVKLNIVLASAEGTRLTGSMGNYEIVERIGVGGMGEVFRATYVAPNMEPRPVALKMVKAGTEGAETLRRLCAETNLLSRLVHPNIVAIWDSGESETGDPFFVMELLEGVLPIDEYCSSRHLGVFERSRLIQKVSSVVHYLHGKNIAHRDLKPGNILVTAMGEPKLLDFGLSMFIERVADAPSFVNSTVTPRRLGTPGFMSLNQASGGPACVEDDIYGLGKTLELCLEELPASDCDLGNDMRALSFSCRSEDASRRPQSAEELGNRLSVLANIAENPKAKQPSRKLKWIVAIAASVVFSFGGLTAYRTHDQKQQAAARADKLVRELKQHEAFDADVNRTVALMGLPFAETLKRITRKNGDFSQQIAYSRKLIAANDSVAKAILGSVVVSCRLAVPGAKQVLQSKTREQRRLESSKSRYPKLNGNGVQQGTPSIDEEIYRDISLLEERAIAALDDQCSSAKMQEAVGWFKDLAKNGQSAAAAFVAMILTNGLGGMEKDHREAFLWAKEAIKGGHPEGYAALGDIYFAGTGIPQDIDAAIENWKQAAEYGSLLAQGELAIVYRNGFGSTQMNKIEAFKWASIAAQNHQGLLIGMDDSFDLMKHLRDGALKSRDEIAQEMSPADRRTASVLAKHWRAKTFKAHKMQETMPDHNAIREAVLGQEDVLETAEEAYMRLTKF